MAMAALLSTASIHAHYPTESLYDRGTQLGAAFHRTVSNPISQESKWWSDFENSKENILIYVEKLASKDSEAAMWFLVTGGKHGFSARQATQEEEKLILSAMQKVAKSFASSENKKEAYEKWVGMEKAHQAGHIHLKMIYQQIDELKRANESLSLRVGALETKNVVLENALQSEREERRKDVKNLNDQLSKTEEKLKEERLERIKDIKALHDQRIQDAKDHQEAIDRAVAAAEEKSAKQFRDWFVEFKQQAEDSRKEQSEMIKSLREERKESTDKFLQVISRIESNAKEREDNFLLMIEKNKQEAREEAKKREEELLARIAKIEQEAREREQAILSVIGKDVDRLPNIERLADKSVELGFQTRDLSQETLRSTNPTAFNQFLKNHH